jgi:hypothetical protein
MEAWKRTAGRLNTWKIPHSIRPLERLQPLMRWAAAGACAGLVLLAAAGIGRLTTAANSRQAKAALAQEMRLELRKEVAALVQQELSHSTSATLTACAEQTRQLLTNYTQTIETNRIAQDAAYYAALEKLYVTLKKEVDTVAVFTDAGLRDTQRRLVQLVDYPQSPAASKSMGN